MTPERLSTLACECGATHFSPPPLRAVRGWSFTHEQLAAFAEAVAVGSAQIGMGRALAHRVVDAHGAPLTDWIDGAPDPNVAPAFIGGRFQCAYDKPGSPTDEKVTLEMIRAGGAAARAYFERTGRNSPEAIYLAMRAVATGRALSDG